MRKYLLFGLTFVFAALPPIGAIQAQSLNLEQVLSRMDERGDQLQSMSADIVQRKWTDILGEFDQGERGRFYFLRRDDTTFLRKDIEQPSQNVLTIAGGDVLFYQPSLKQAQRYQLGTHKDKTEFLLLGFGSDPQALKEAYEIELLGQEDVDGQTAYRLELTPRSKQTAAFFVRIELWVDSDLWVPIQQKLVEPTQDYLLINFSDIELNPDISRSRFEVKLPSDVRVIKN